MPGAGNAMSASSGQARQKRRILSFLFMVPPESSGLDGFSDPGTKNRQAKLNKCLTSRIFDDLWNLFFPAGLNKVMMNA
jgi:hypothetical protein